ncbi:M56 family metallopeptidase [Anaerococcus sp. NML200574]|uniref:M56 family metallopeptidase n=1 Tax=Anaerococcus sp. NML200574 TaxID=2954486 RepID=UPI002238A542|nr:M56 family metallopeptidase [Anaerococcus sp. NML200574]MCW6677647.1 M56 family metallopeptidase [Anaerococcus sp. NML200574]
MIVTIVYQMVIEKAIKSTWILFLILLFRKRLNIKSFKSSTAILWIFFLLYLIIPYGIRFQFENNYGNGLLFKFIKVAIFVNDKIYVTMMFIGSFLYPLNRMILSLPLCIYLIYKIYIFKKVINNSKIYEDKRILNTIRSFNLKRQVRVYINDDLKSPITFGVLRPKIVIQREVIEDTKLLDHVLIHELMHIKKYHIIFNHIVNILSCIYWFNPIFWLSIKRAEQDIEINYDKEVINKLGDSRKIRKDYCKSLLKFMEMNFYKNSFYLRMNPNKERIEVMKNYKTTINGIIGFIIILVLSMPAYASVNYIDYDRVTLVEGAAVEDEVIGDDRVEIISNKEYEKLDLGEVSTDSLRSANINNRIIVPICEFVVYKFNMKSNTTNNHDSFTIKFSNMNSRDKVAYRVVIREGGKTFYNRRFSRDIILSFQANINSSYSVVIYNDSDKELTGNVNINSYKK